MAVPRALQWLAARLDSPDAPGPPPPASSPLDFSNYPSSGLQQFGFFVLFFFPALSLLVVALRLYGRLSTKTFGWDDVFIIPALLTALAEAVCSYLMMRLLFIGVHASDIPVPRPKTGNLAGIMNYVVVMLYNPQLGLVKSSVLFFLLRLGGQKTIIRWSIHILNIVNLAMLVAVFVASVFTCVPIAKYWDRSIDGRCNNKGLQYIVTSSITVLTDVAVLVLPFIIVVGLQLPRRLKIGLLTLLCLGLIATVFSVLRLLMLVRLHYGTAGPDSTYNIDFVYSTVECNLAIICASIPALSNSLKQWCPRFFTKASGAEAGMPYLEGTDYSGSGATKTIGGTSMVLKTIRMGPGRSGYLRKKSLTRSEEDILGVDRLARAFEDDMTADDRHAPHEDVHLPCYYPK